MKNAYQTKEQAHRLRCSAGMTAACKMTYKFSKLGQTDLVFGLWSEFICTYVNELCSRLWLVIPSVQYDKLHMHVNWSQLLCALLRCVNNLAETVTQLS